MKKILIMLALLLNPLITNAVSNSNIDVKFCNGREMQNSLSLGILQPNSEENICVYTKNTSNNNVKVTLYLVDGVINPATPQFTVCQSEEFEDKDFAKKSYFEEGGNKVEFYLEGNGEVKKYIKTKFQNGPKRIAHGCVVAHVQDPESKNGMINVVLRKAITLKAEIDGNLTAMEDDIESEKIKLAKDKEELAMIEKKEELIKQENEKPSKVKINGEMFKADILNINNIDNTALQKEDNNDEKGLFEFIKGIFKKDVENKNIEERNEGNRKITVKKDAITLFVEKFSEGVKNAFASLFNF